MTLEELRERYERASTDDARFEALKPLARALSAAGHLAPARQAFEAALRLRPEDPEMLYGLRTVLQQLGEPEPTAIDDAATDAGLPALTWPEEQAPPASHEFPPPKTSAPPRTTSGEVVAFSAPERTDLEPLLRRAVWVVLALGAWLVVQLSRQLTPTSPPLFAGGVATLLTSLALLADRAPRLRWVLVLPLLFVTGAALRAHGGVEAAVLGLLALGAAVLAALEASPARLAGALGLALVPTALLVPFSLDRHLASNPLADVRATLHGQRPERLATAVSVSQVATVMVPAGWRASDGGWTRPALGAALTVQAQRVPGLASRPPAELRGLVLRALPLLHGAPSELELQAAESASDAPVITFTFDTPRGPRALEVRFETRREVLTVVAVSAPAHRAGAVAGVALQVLASLAHSEPLPPAPPTPVVTAARAQLVFVSAANVRQPGYLFHPDAAGSWVVTSSQLLDAVGEVTVELPDGSQAPVKTLRATRDAQLGVGAFAVEARGPFEPSRFRHGAALPEGAPLWAFHGPAPVDEAWGALPRAVFSAGTLRAADDEGLEVALSLRAADVGAPAFDASGALVGLATTTREGAETNTLLPADALAGFLGRATHGASPHWAEEPVPAAAASTVVSFDGSRWPALRPSLVTVAVGAERSPGVVLSKRSDGLVIFTTAALTASDAPTVESLEGRAVPTRVLRRAPALLLAPAGALAQAAPPDFSSHFPTVEGQLWSVNVVDTLPFTRAGRPSAAPEPDDELLLADLGSVDEAGRAALVLDGDYQPVGLAVTGTPGTHQTVVATPALLEAMLLPSLLDAGFRLIEGTDGFCRLQVHAWLSDPLRRVQSLNVRLVPAAGLDVPAGDAPLPGDAVLREGAPREDAEVAALVPCVVGPQLLQVELTGIDFTQRTRPVLVPAATTFPGIRRGRTGATRHAPETEPLPALQFALARPTELLEFAAECDAKACRKPCEAGEPAACLQLFHTGLTPREARKPEAVLGAVCQAGSTAACLELARVGAVSAEVRQRLRASCALGLGQACVAETGHWKPREPADFEASASGPTFRTATCQQHFDELALRMNSRLGPRTLELCLEDPAFRRRQLESLVPLPEDWSPKCVAHPATAQEADDCVLWAMQALNAPGHVSAEVLLSGLSAAVPLSTAAQQLLPELRAAR